MDLISGHYAPGDVFFFEGSKDGFKDKVVIREEKGVGRVLFRITLDNWIPDICCLAAVLFAVSLVSTGESCWIPDTVYRNDQLFAGIRNRYELHPYVPGNVSGTEIPGQQPGQVERNTARRNPRFSP